MNSLQDEPDLREGLWLPANCETIRGSEESRGSGRPSSPLGDASEESNYLAPLNRCFQRAQSTADGHLI